tara:strand:+ start:361 stop:498 length:138 start_codon:yes stop_codon:yes gene_type:complete
MVPKSTPINEIKVIIFEIFLRLLVNKYLNAIWNKKIKAKYLSKYD